MEHMTLSADPDVQAVAEFMQACIPTARLVGVAAGVSALAPLLWGHYEAEAVRSLRLRADGPRTQSNASESHPERLNADDGSGAAVNVPP